MSRKISISVSEINPVCLIYFLSWISGSLTFEEEVCRVDTTRAHLCVIYIRLHHRRSETVRKTFLTDRTKALKMYFRSKHLNAKNLSFLGNVISVFFALLSLCKASDSHSIFRFPLQKPRFAWYIEPGQWYLY